MSPGHTDSRPPAFTGAVDAAEYRRVLEAFTGVPATEGNRVQVLRNGDQIFPAMLDAVNAAERTVDFMTFVYWTGNVANVFADALAKRARAGVRVRVLVDAFGARQMENDVVGRMRRAGVLVEKFRPFTSWKVWRWNMRTHRRVLVVDDTVAFTGGVGIAQEWEGDAEEPGRWRDTHYKVEGPAVDAIHAAFYSDWFEVPRPVFDGRDRFPRRGAAGTSTVQVIRAASQPGWNDAALAMGALMTLARDRIRVTSAYFRPPEYFLTLLCQAAARGVDVEVLVPGPYAEPKFYRWTAEFHYGELLDHGVRIWRYQPTMHHAKIVTVDGAVALVGTTNFDSRSLALNEQIAMLIHDPQVVATLDDHFDDDCENSESIDPRRWAQRSWRERALATGAHVATFGLRASGATRRGGMFR